MPPQQFRSSLLASRQRKRCVSQNQPQANIREETEKLFEKYPFYHEEVPDLSGMLQHFNKKQQVNYEINDKYNFDRNISHYNQYNTTTTTTSTMHHSHHIDPIYTYKQLYLPPVVTPLKSKLASRGLSHKTTMDSYLDDLNTTLFNKYLKPPPPPHGTAAITLLAPIQSNKGDSITTMSSYTPRLVAHSSCTTSSPINDSIRKYRVKRPQATSKLSDYLQKCQQILHKDDQQDTLSNNEKRYNSLDAHSILSAARPSYDSMTIEEVDLEVTRAHMYHPPFEIPVKQQQQQQTPIIMSEQQQTNDSSNMHSNGIPKRKPSRSPSTLPLMIDVITKKKIPKSTYLTLDQFVNTDVCEINAQPDCKVDRDSVAAKLKTKQLQILGDFQTKKVSRKVQQRLCVEFQDILTQISRSNSPEL